MTDIRPIPFGTRCIGPGHPTVIIAEIGINHEGDAGICLELVRKAAEAGADAIKLQTLDADENYVPGTESHDIFSKGRLSREETAKAFDLARSLGMEALTTCGDLATLAWVDDLHPAAHKISSGLITHIPLIRAAAATRRPLIISTGMSDLDAARAAVRAAREAGGTDICLLQCTSIYPAPAETLNLRSIETLRWDFECPSGFSDHSLGVEAASLAVAAGANALEKHFSLDPTKPGFDHPISVDPAGMKQLVAAVRRAETILGTAEKAFTAEQKNAADKYLRSIVARRDIDTGETLSFENVGFMRTAPEGRGLPPSTWEQFQGRRVARRLSRYQIIKPEYLAD